MCVVVLKRIDGMPGFDDRYNHAPNDSPRSGSSKKAPVIWGAVIVAIVVLAIWLAMKS
jgi:hypothetical protein